FTSTAGRPEARMSPPIPRRSPAMVLTSESAMPGADWAVPRAVSARLLRKPAGRIVGTVGAVPPEMSTVADPVLPASTRAAMAGAMEPAARARAGAEARADPWVRGWTGGAGGGGRGPPAGAGTAAMARRG